MSLLLLLLLLESMLKIVNSLCLQIIVYGVGNGECYQRLNRMHLHRTNRPFFVQAFGIFHSVICNTARNLVDGIVPTDCQCHHLCAFTHRHHSIPSVAFYWTIPSSTSQESLQVCRVRQKPRMNQTDPSRRYLPPPELFVFSVINSIGKLFHLVCIRFIGAAHSYRECSWHSLLKSWYTFATDKSPPPPPPPPSQLTMIMDDEPSHLVTYIRTQYPNQLRVQTKEEQNKNIQTYIDRQTDRHEGKRKEGRKKGRKEKENARDNRTTFSRGGNKKKRKKERDTSACEWFPWSRWLKQDGTLCRR